MRGGGREAAGREGAGREGGEPEGARREGGEPEGGRSESASRQWPPLLVAAAVAGLTHAAFSLYWALGGRALLDTVGAWAVDYADRSPLAAGLALTGVAAVKVAGAVVPVLVEQGRLPGRRVWRVIAAAGAVVLVVYGGVNTVVAWAVLGGLIETAGGYDRAAMLGHAALWDPLFLLWGLLLGLGLLRTRSSNGPDVSR